MAEVKEKYKKFMFNRRFDATEDEMAITESEIKNLLGSDSENNQEDENELEKIIKEEAQEIEPPEEVYIPPTFTQEQLDEEIIKAKNEGIAQGKKESEESLLKTETDTILKIENQISEIKKSVEEDCKKQETDFIDICSLIFKKLMPELEKKHGFSEIQGVIEQSLPRLIKEPQLKIAINPTQIDDLKEKLTNIAKKVGFLGKIVIQNNEELKLGDVKIEWNKGGIIKDSDLVMNEIDKILSLYSGKNIETEKENV